ncbi:hypothetical protein K5M36_08805 [Chromobacterium vaccinii]|nr:hypothetical protein [Chromobacterium vaccinii]
MSLKSNNEQHQAYLDSPAVLMDTSALTWFAKNDGFPQLLNLVSDSYMILVPTPVLYELAFGTKDSVDSRELWLRDSIGNFERELDAYKFGQAKQQGKLPRSGIYFLNPGHQEWYSARERLIRLSTLKGGAKIKEGKSRHTLDSLIFSCARNCFVPICTSDKDFKELNRAAAAAHYERSVPIFTPDQLVASLDEDVWCTS